MRKLFNFCRLIFCYLMMLPLMLFLCCEFILLGIMFLFVDISKFETVFTSVSNQYAKIIEDTINQIKKEEYDVLNADIIERCKNGEYGLRLKKLSWYKEIFITVFILVLICFVLKILRG